MYGTGKTRNEPRIEGLELRNRSLSIEMVEVEWGGLELSSTGPWDEDSIAHR